jgi:hypothetical protein
MSRDNLLFATLGVLAGFISGYFVHEVMAVRQPPSLAVLQAAQAAAGGSPHAGAGAPGAPGDPGGGQGVPGGPGGQGGPQMAEIQRLRQQVESNPEDADAILQLANLNYDIRSWDRARELYLRYLQLRPPQADVLTDLGVAHRGMGQFDEALQRFEEAEKLQEGHWQSLFNQVVVLAFDLKDQRRADELLARLREMQPNNPDVERLAREVERARSPGAA